MQKITYPDNWNYLTAQEAKASIEQGVSKQELVSQFKLSKEKIEKLLAGKTRYYRLPKSSMWYDPEEEA